MDGLTFTSKLIESLAWPVTTVLLVALLRKPIIELVPLMKKLKYKELELEFSQEVSELKAEADASLIIPKSSESTQGEDSNRILSLVSFSTRTAIMEAWIEVETAAIEIASSFWTQPPNEVFINMPKLGEYLLKCKIFDKKQLHIFNTLRQLRNKSAHEEELNISENVANLYVQMASDLAKHIRHM